MEKAEADQDKIRAGTDRALQAQTRALLQVTDQMREREGVRLTVEEKLAHQVTGDERVETAAPRRPQPMSACARSSKTVLAATDIDESRIIAGTIYADHVANR